MNKYNIGDTVFLIVSNQIIREVTIIKFSGGLYTIRFVKGGGGLRVRENRLFATRDEAAATLSKPSPSQSPYYHSPWS